MELMRGQKPLQALPLAASRADDSGDDIAVVWPSLGGFRFCNSL